MRVDRRREKEPSKGGEKKRVQNLGGDRVKGERERGCKKKQGKGIEMEDACIEREDGRKLEKAGRVKE